MDNLQITKEERNSGKTGFLIGWTHAQHLAYLNSFKKMECPHRLSCPEADLNKKKHCPGRLFNFRSHHGSGTLAIKCEKTKRIMLFKLENNRITHITEDTEEFTHLEKSLTPLNCASCDQRIFDAIAVRNRIEILIKCPRDKKEMIFLIKPEETLALE